MDIFVAAIAGGVMGGIVAVILTLGLLRRDRRMRQQGLPHATADSGQWRVPRGPLFSRFSRRPPAAPPTAPVATEEQREGPRQS
jgi:hypothetical protein